MMRKFYWLTQTQYDALSKRRDERHVAAFLRELDYCRSEREAIDLMVYYVHIMSMEIERLTKTLTDLAMLRPPSPMIFVASEEDKVRVEEMLKSKGEPEIIAVDGITMDVTCGENP